MEIKTLAIQGLTLHSITGAEYGCGEVDMITREGRVFKMFHRQDCCEDVSVEEVIGDIQDLVGEVIVEAVELSNVDEPFPKKENYYEDSYQWTFYKFRTIKGEVVLRWLGQSNGYYGMGVDFEEQKPINAGLLK